MKILEKTGTLVVHRRYLRLMKSSQELKRRKRISRKSRSIETSKKWKATEWRNWIEYLALPCLDDVLPEPFFSHLATYCEAIFIFNSASITNEDHITARNLMIEFVRGTQERYGLYNMLPNVHFSDHLPKSTEDWGPVWVFSTLHFEALNRKIVDSSPNHRAEQIVTRFFMRKFIRRCAEHENLSLVTRNQIRNLLETKIKNIPPGVLEAHYFVGRGRPVMRVTNPKEMQIIAESGAQIETNTFAKFYDKAVVHGVRYAKQTEEDFQYCDYIAFCRNVGLSIIKKIISYRLEEETITGFIAKQFEDEGGAYGTSYMRFVTPSHNQIFASYHDVLAPGIIIEAKKGTVAVHLSNCWETD